jgi:hypothetical protein
MKDNGIEFNGEGATLTSYYGPLASLTEFKPYSFPHTGAPLVLPWAQVKSVGFARWQRWWNYLSNILKSNPNFSRGGTNFVILTTVSGETYLSPVGPGRLRAWEFNQPFIEWLRTSGKASLVSESVAKV